MTAELFGTVHVKDEATTIARVVEEKNITDPAKQKPLFPRPGG